MCIPSSANYKTQSDYKSLSPKLLYRDDNYCNDGVKKEMGSDITKAKILSMALTVFYIILGMFALTLALTNGNIDYHLSPSVVIITGSATIIILSTIGIFLREDKAPLFGLLILIFSIVNFFAFTLFAPYNGFYTIPGLIIFILLPLVLGVGVGIYTIGGKSK